VNYFAHGWRFVEEPYFLAGTAVPDWLNVVDRKVRVRSKHALLHCDATDPVVAAVARGVAQHHRDDAWFHETASFAELSWGLTVFVRDALAPDPGLRPSFLAHILVEILLDATLIAEDPASLEAYYRAVERLDPEAVQSAVNCLAPTPCERLAEFVAAFCRERFLWDYTDDARLWYRLNQVMRRVKLAPLPEEFRDLLPEARRMVAERKVELLTPPISENHP
jgi:hypothetical protein